MSLHKIPSKTLLGIDRRDIGLKFSLSILAPLLNRAFNLLTFHLSFTRFVLFFMSIIQDGNRDRSKRNAIDYKISQDQARLKAQTAWKT